MRIKKRMLLIVLALSLVGVMGTAFAASAGTSDPAYTWYNGDHYLQCFELKNIYGTGWRYTDGVENPWYEPVLKSHSNRDFVSQVKQTNLTAYSAAFIGVMPYHGDQETAIAWVRGVAANNAKYLYGGSAGLRYSMASRADNRATGTYRTYGVWSPDTY